MEIDSFNEKRTRYGFELMVEWEAICQILFVELNRNNGWNGQGLAILLTNLFFCSPKSGFVRLPLHLI